MEKILSNRPSYSRGRSKRVLFPLNHACLSFWREAAKGACFEATSQIKELYSEGLFWQLWPRYTMNCSEMKGFYVGYHDILIPKSKSFASAVSWFSRASLPFFLLLLVGAATFFVRCSDTSVSIYLFFQMVYFFQSNVLKQNSCFQSNLILFGVP